MKYTEEQLRESEDRARAELNRIRNHIEKFFNNNMPGIVMNLRKAENLKEIVDSFQGKTITIEIKKLIENRIQELLLDEWLKINTPEIKVNIDLDYGSTHIDGLKMHFSKCASEYLFKSQTKEEIKDYYTKRYKNVSDFNVDDDGNVTFTCTIKMPDFPDNVNIELSEDLLARYNEIGNED